MKVEIRPPQRPELPRYFPPGYFDWTFWLMVATNLFTPVWCAGWAYFAASNGQTIALAFQCGILTLGLWTASRSARIVLRHSRQWRTVDRPECEARLAQAEREMLQYLQTFHDWQASQGAQNGNSDDAAQ